MNGSVDSKAFTIPKINGSRLMSTLHETCEFGKAHPYGEQSTETGMARLSLSDSDKAVREWLVAEGKSMGLTTFYDEMGNTFIVRPGRDSAQPPIMMGSHLDTQPTGGRYDGILGVMAGLEVLRVLCESNIQTVRSVGLVDWTNEEGARFPTMAVSSGVWAGVIPLETAWNLAEIPQRNVEKCKTMKEELLRIGFLGDTPASWTKNPFAAHFELHIEQGPILEEEQRKIGVVKGAQAFKWYSVTITGRDSHAGTTPLHARRDALCCAAKMIAVSNDLAHEHNGLATTGMLTCEPGSVNTMAKKVTFSLDIRHATDEGLAALDDACKRVFERIARHESAQGCQIEWTSLVDSPAVKFDETCIKMVEQSAAEVCAGLAQTQETSKAGRKDKDDKLWKYMISGAGHDSCYTSKRCPTAMIFTPTREGISHNPTEYCSPEDCILGAQTLMGAVLRYDQYLAQP